MKNRAVFLDRDGVINRAIVRDGKPYPPSSIYELEIPQDVPEALNKLKAANYKIIVITNQPDVARGTTKRETVELIHAHMLKNLPIDSIRSCYHDSQDNCNCRKPQAGAILSAAIEFEVDLANSFMIGDRWRDIEAGQRAGCETLFIDYGYLETQPSSPNHIVKCLNEAIDIILNFQRN
jgi:D-glycero-D-manno-heptose 1,7-bisphosphate phosphatase